MHSTWQIQVVDASWFRQRNEEWWALQPHLAANRVAAKSREKYYCEQTFLCLTKRLLKKKSKLVGG